MDPPLCSPAELAISAKPGALLHCLTRNESIAHAFSTLTSAVSVTACVVTFALILRNVLYHARRMPGHWRLIKVPMDIYLLSLFSGEMILCMAGVINGKWVHDGKLEVGGWCTVQSVMLSVGSTTASSSILAIAVHTFVMVWCNKGFRALKLACIVISIPWIYSIIYLAAISSVHRTGSDVLFRPTPYWCWIHKKYMVHRLFASYLWMWTSLLVSIIVYVPLFFWGRGNITIGDRFWSFEVHKRQVIDDPDGVRRRALRMIAYPLVFAVLIVPVSVARWIGFVQESHGDKKNHVPGTVLIAVHTIYKLSGVTNVALFLLTRPSLLLFNRDADHPEVDLLGNSLYQGANDSIENRGEHQLQAGNDDGYHDKIEGYISGQSGYRI